MASGRMLERAETAMEIAGDFLFDDDENDDGEDDDEGSENADAENDPEEDASELNEDEQGKNTNKDKASRGMGKKLKSVMGVAMRPFGGLHWKLNFNFDASNSASKQKDKNNRAPKPAQPGGRERNVPPPNGEGKKSLSPDAAKIRSLKRENERLEKLADKFLEECIRLKTKLGELAEVDGQLTAARSNNEQLKEELHESQRSRDSLIAKVSKQSEEHRAELKKAAKDLAKVEQDNKFFEDRDKRNVDKLCLLKKELETLSTERDELTVKLREQAEKHRSETRQLTEESKKAENEKHDLYIRHSDTIAKLKAVEKEHVTLQQEFLVLGMERDTALSNLKASNSKVDELWRAIVVLESSQSSSTTAVAANGGARFSCPLCGEQFAALANMHLHAEDCGT